VRIFLAGATGVLGVRLVPLLVAAGHTVVGMTRSADKAELLAGLGATPVVVDVYDGEALTRAMIAAAPELVLHELTDLPDDRAAIPADRGRNVRMRTEGTDNLVAAMRSAGVSRIVAQSIAWRPEGGRTSVDHLEQTVLGLGGVVLRYGQFHGPGTYFPDPANPPADPRVGLDRAARATVEHLDAPTGVYTVVD
jgi:uncharacterized protein YbjT (DUF2867 family)